MRHTGVTQEKNRDGRHEAVRATGLQLDVQLTWGRRLMSDYEVTLVNDNMQEFYVRFSGPDESAYRVASTVTLWLTYVAMQRRSRAGCGRSTSSCRTRTLTRARALASPTRSFIVRLSLRLCTRFTNSQEQPTLTRSRARCAWT